MYRQLTLSLLLIPALASPNPGSASTAVAVAPEQKPEEILTNLLTMNEKFEKIQQGIEHTILATFIPITNVSNATVETTGLSIDVASLIALYAAMPTEEEAFAALVTPERLTELESYEPHINDIEKIRHHPGYSKQVQQWIDTCIKRVNWPHSPDLNILWRSYGYKYKPIVYHWDRLLQGDAKNPSELYDIQPWMCPCCYLLDNKQKKLPCKKLPYGESVPLIRVNENNPLFLLQQQAYITYMLQQIDAYSLNKIRINWDSTKTSIEYIKSIDQRYTYFQKLRFLKTRLIGMGRAALFLTNEAQYVAQFSNAHSTQRAASTAAAAPQAGPSRPLKRKAADSE
jgi:hypothetical protein